MKKTDKEQRAPRFARWTTLRTPFKVLTSQYTQLIRDKVSLNNRAGSELGLGRSPGLDLCLRLVCWLGRSAELGEHLARLGSGLVRDRVRDRDRVLIGLG